MFKLFTLRGSYKYVDKFHEMMKEYNNNFHRSIQMKPADVTKEDEENLLILVNGDQNYMHRTKFKINQFVRVSRFKGVFEKGYTPNWGTEIFKIVKVNKLIPETYILQSYDGEILKGQFYRQELQLVKHPEGYLIEKVLRKKGNKSFVKFLGFDNTHNDWVENSTFSSYK